MILKSFKISSEYLLIGELKPATFYKKMFIVLLNNLNKILISSLLLIFFLFYFLT